MSGRRRCEHRRHLGTRLGTRLANWPWDGVWAQKTSHWLGPCAPCSRIDRPSFFLRLRNQNPARTGTQVVKVVVKAVVKVVKVVEPVASPLLELPLDCDAARGGRV